MAFRPFASQVYHLAVFEKVSSQQCGLEVFQCYELNARQYSAIITYNVSGYTASFCSLLYCGGNLMEYPCCWGT